MDYALQNMDVGLVLLDSARRVLSLNPAAVRLLGDRAAGLIGAYLHDLHPPSHRAKVELLLAAAGDPAAPASACSMMVALPGRVLVVKATALAPAAVVGEGSAVTALMLMEAARPVAAETQAPPLGHSV